ncbi:hypothetical protein [Aidingimonas halophila]|uniref:Uncharacterized protein n=1 Tax=Aidingimonas halophila TaxID=574349 RepID=A0A1H2UNC8_9GAMM|nr:hypothetical protein [Aidingimonas halophila]GHC22914.1 hypothetical protein GCM10008094_11970 [Aidingimonas halophila]SDW57621.1 hypothetical protein SAMN05443545_102197 [Aidingimonas halophila]
MIWHLIAAMFAGLAAAGIALLLRVISGKRLPRWIIPAFAGAGMLSYQVHHEYTWYSHKEMQLPDSAQVISTEQEATFWRPWTYLFPMTTAFTVVDHDNLSTNETEDERVVEFILYRFEKQPTDQVSHQAYLLNCSAEEIVPLTEEFEQRQDVELRRISTSSQLYQAVCPSS